MAFGGENAESYYDEGLTASMKGDLAQAIKHFEKAAELDRSFFAAYHQLAKCYMRIGKARKAARILKQVVAVKPNNIPARVDLGFALLENGELAEARDHFAQVSAAKPDNHRAKLGMAHCSFHEGQWDAAVRLAQEAAAAGGANFAALFLTGRAARLAGRLEVAEEALSRAAAMLEKSIESNPDSPEGDYLRGEVQFARDYFGNALDDYRAAEDRAVPGVHYAAYGEHFTKVDILAKRGVCLQRMGRIDGAKEAGEQILRIEPEHKLGKHLRDL